VEGSDAAFAMATQGVGSAVVLNVMLWISLFISIPLAGFQLSNAHAGPFHGLAIYLLLALVALVALVLITFVIFLVTRGEEAAARFVRAVGRRIPGVGADRLEGFVRTVGDNLRALGRRPDIIRVSLIWGALNWLLDAASLWCFVASFGWIVNPIELFAVYGIANVVAVIPVSPGGLGLVEAVSSTLIVSLGPPAKVALFSVLAWRLVNFWLPIPLGAASYLSLRVPRSSGLRARRTALSEMTARTDGEPPSPQSS
jgi:uncharacterized protein (TIRG00374 family)